MQIALNFAQSWVTFRLASCSHLSGIIHTARRICTTSLKLMVSAAWSRPFFDPGDPCITSDAVFGVQASLMAAFKPVNDQYRIVKAGF